MNSYIMLGIAAFVLLASLAQAMQINGIKNELTGNAVAQGGSDGSTGGETYEDMMARMHPDQVVQQAQPAANSQPAMVGGC
ncbi:MAG: hypothetical protein HY367_03720 [Candidatus Aenigmarchaeota archaeon]|nr:hypothetical protein [Candidatus Aenigmarchaeota archaeon]